MSDYNEYKEFSEIKKEITGWQIQPVGQAEAGPKETAKMIMGAAIEQHQWESYQHFVQSTDNMELKKLYTRIAVQEEEHLSKGEALMDPQMSPVEMGLALQMTAVEGLAAAAQMEPEETCRKAYDYILLDHLSQLKIMADKVRQSGVDPLAIVGDAIDIREGRPIDNQFVGTEDLIKEALPKGQVDKAGLVNVHTVIAAEMDLRNMFHVLRRRFTEADLRLICSLVTSVAGLHMAMLDSMLDPQTTTLEYAMANELAELRVHKLGMEASENEAAKKVHQYAYDEDEEHLEWLQDAYARIESGDPEKFAIMENLFEDPPLSVREYVNQMINTAILIRPHGTGFRPAA